jgi:hypothetical protein
LERHTSYDDDKGLIPDHASMESAPFSRFVIFLENHRMMLILNEKSSPNIITFQATIKAIISHFIIKQNHVNPLDEKLPDAEVNIVSMPLRGDIESVLKDVKKIKYVKWNFFQLNGDTDYGPAFEHFNKLRSSVGSKTSNYECNSPTNKNGVIEAVSDTATKGLAVASVRAEYSDGRKVTIKDNEFSSSNTIDIFDNITGDFDSHIVKSASKVPELNRTSDENTNIFNRSLSAIKKWMHK